VLEYDLTSFRLSEIANLVQHRKGLDVTKEVSALSDKPIGRGCFCEVYEAIWSCPSTDGANAWGTRSLPVVVKIMSGEVMKTMEVIDSISLYDKG
jgi:hypothetical protein